MLHNIPESKQCLICKETKDSSQFSVDSSRVDGLKFACRECFKTYVPKNSKTKLSDVVKNCDNCKRQLGARSFAYSQHTADHLTETCRTCRLRKRARPSIDEVTAFENIMQDIYTKSFNELSAKYKENKDMIIEKHRGEFEELVFKEMHINKLLKDWKTPIWMHSTSKTQ